MTRLLIFGRTGQVATELRRRVPQGVSLQVLGRQEVDLTAPQAAAEAIAASDANAVINAAAYTAVDQAEEDEAQATTINAAAPGAMARAAAAKGIPFVHVSTDYVFSGAGTRAWRPSDPVGPIGAYGRSKLAGEDAVRAAGGPHAIMRTSWVFSAHGNNFVKTMLRLSESRDRVSVVDDQVGGPTAAADIADALFAQALGLLRDPATSGTYHFSNAPDVSWAGFAREIFAQAGKSTEVVDIPSAEFPTKAARPMNSRLDCTDIARVFDVARPDWRASLADVLQELGAA
ncbi:dTDP-4-dehydrorhamnose reductase [Candidatus Rhodobacter oscarellae]|uniref:dTDP-4-dehydrorhamnose reductase n=1 Tax=Candidatus Rhodobacter oscarellae TaxID=1675527 RepID=A0A0J9E5K5_9RHOB|nr:dTDP-4-dehydrorhamnose reductase [Candidatus Rhodobacter lobularis]KMW58022.1 dTDP-4-dehydrorhamnose reductase [Candidatus Rhodobacter lobularis]